MLKRALTYAIVGAIGFMALFLLGKVPVVKDYVAKLNA